MGAAEQAPQSSSSLASKVQPGKERDELLWRVRYLANELDEALAELESHEAKGARASLARATRVHLKETIEDRKTREIQELRDSGRLIASIELAKRRGVVRSTITEAYNAHRLFRFTEGRSILYPSFFGDASFNWTHLERITRALGRLSNFQKLYFFNTKLNTLGDRSPLDVLRSKTEEDYRKVLREASDAGETDVE